MSRCDRVHPCLRGAFALRSIFRLSGAATMWNWIKSFLDYISAEGRVVTGAPVAFSAFVLLASLGIWFALSWKFTAQIDSRDSIIAARDSVIAARDATIKFQDALIAEYKNRLQIPTETGEDRRLTSEQK